jgi:hypothetical protein
VDLASYLISFVYNLILGPGIGTASVCGVREPTAAIDGVDETVVARGFHFLVKLFIISFGRFGEFNSNKKARHKYFPVI